MRELAADYGNALYESRKAQKTITDNKTLSQVRKVDAAIRDLLAKDNPDYAKINEIYNLNNNLYNILQETSHRQGWSFFTMRRLIESGLGATGITTGPVSGHESAIAIPIATIGIMELTNSTWWNTLRAVQKNNVIKFLQTVSFEKIGETATKLALKGIDYWNELQK